MYPAKARRQIENLCRYAARPAVATERLSKLADGRMLYRLRHQWRDGTSHVIFEPLDLIGKLAALVPPPRFNLVSWAACPLGPMEIAHCAGGGSAVGGIGLAELPGLC